MYFHSFVNTNLKLEILWLFQIRIPFVTDFNNDFFVNIGPTLAKSIPKVDKGPLNYRGNRLTEFINLEPVTKKEIDIVIKMLWRIQQPLLMTWIPYPLRYLLNFRLSHWPTSVICLLLKEFLPSQTGIGNVIPETTIVVSGYSLLQKCWSHVVR